MGKCVNLFKRNLIFLYKLITFGAIAIVPPPHLFLNQFNDFFCIVSVV